MLSEESSKMVISMFDGRSGDGGRIGGGRSSSERSVDVEDNG